MSKDYGRLCATSEAFLYRCDDANYGKGRLTSARALPNCLSETLG